MDTCRNCASSDLRNLGFIGRIAPFFLKRVFQIEVRTPVSPHPLKQFLRTLTRPVSNLFAKLHANEAYLEMQICRSCTFLQARQPFPEDWITRLYVDYRAPSYNAERTQYEPSYGAIAARVGTDDREVANRVAAATKFVASKLAPGPGFTMLDFGGADGRFLPQMDATKFVYEISDIAPIAGVTRIATEAELSRYSYVHLAHVLEHVVQPLQLVQKVSQYIEPGGYLYIETPQEVSDADLQRFLNGATNMERSVHEHINAYSIAAVTKLFEAAGLELVAAQADRMDVGWASATHLRALARKP